MDKQDAYYQKLNQILAEQQVKKAVAETQTAQASAFSNPMSSNLIMLQLDLDSELDRIFHLLSGDRIGLNAEGSTVWLSPTDDRERIFSDYGVKQIMQLISFYINKNTLLSYYDYDTINNKMHDFGIALSDLIYARKDSFFYYPNPEELFDKYWPVVKDHKLDIDKEELYNSCVKWSKQELEGKQNHFRTICLAIIDSVHSTYLRAYQGRERDSLRKSFNVMQSDTLSPLNNQNVKKGEVYGMR